MILDGAKIMTFSGWGQDPKALECVAPGAHHFDYAAYGDSEVCFAALAEMKPQPEVLVGWSLGGQVALRAVLEGALKPKLIMLLATPFQFVKGRYGTTPAMEPHLFEQFKENFVADPDRLLKRFKALVAKGAVDEKRVRSALTLDTCYMFKDWEYWLAELGHFSFKQSEFKQFPHVHIIHGVQDCVVNDQQARLLAAKLYSVDVDLVDGCGHAPHLQCAAYIKECITKDYYEVTAQRAA